MQASTGKLKVDALGGVLTNPAFGPSDGKNRKALKAMVLANLHLFGSKQKKAIQEAVGAWSSAAKRAKSGDQGDKSGSPANTSAEGAGDRAQRGSRRDSSRGRSGSRGRRRSHSRGRDRQRSRSCSRSRSR